MSPITQSGLKFEQGKNQDEHVFVTAMERPIANATRPMISIVPMGDSKSYSVLLHVNLETFCFEKNVGNSTEINLASGGSSVFKYIGVTYQKFKKKKFARLTCGTTFDLVCI